MSGAWDTVLNMIAARMGLLYYIQWKHKEGNGQVYLKW